MGLVGTVVSVTRRNKGGEFYDDIIVDKADGIRITAEAFYAAGQDAQAIAGDLVFLSEGSGSGRMQVTAFLDPKSAQLAQVGENILYSRDSNGQPAASLWLKNDGQAALTGASGGGLEIADDGTVTINGTIFKAGGQVEASTIEGDSIKAAGLELAGHAHAVTSAPGTTGPNQ